VKRRNIIADACHGGEGNGQEENGYNASERLAMTDFGLIGKAVDMVRGKFAARDETRLRERFVSIVHGLGNPNLSYQPKFGSPEYWEAEAMANKGWFTRLPFGAFKRRYVSPDAFL
jgi:hypothetical protein